MSIFGSGTHLAGHQDRALLIERIDAHFQGKQIGIVLLQMLHIPDSLHHELVVDPARIPGQVPDIACGEAVQVVPPGELIEEMKYRPEHVRKRLMLEEIGVSEKHEQKLSPGMQELTQILQHIGINLEVGLYVRYSLNGAFEVLVAPFLADLEALFVPVIQLVHGVEG